MDIFIDTNVLYQDFFFKTTINSQLLNLAKEDEINLYISEVVIAELRRQYKDILTEKNKNITALEHKSHLYDLSYDGLKSIDIEKKLKHFDDFYLNLEIDYSVKILDCKGEFFKPLIDRSTNGKFQFRGDKMEYNDSLIWLTYSHYSKEKKLPRAILLTGNHTDFCNPDNHNEIHPELIEDSNVFVVYQSPKEFFNKESKTLHLNTEAFNKWISSLKLDEKIVYVLLKENFSSEIKEAVKRYCTAIHLNDIFDSKYYKRELNGGIDVTKIEIIECGFVQTAPLKRKLALYGNLKCYLDIVGMEYHAFQDSYTILGNAGFEMILGFSFIYDKSGSVSDFAVNGWWYDDDEYNSDSYSS